MTADANRLSAVGARIRKLRRAQGLTSIALARKIGMSQAQVSRLETGLQLFRSLTLMRFAQVLGTTPTELLLGAEVEPAREMERLGLAPSRTLRSAMCDRRFLRFLKRCALLAGEHRKNLSRMEQLIRARVR